MGKSKTREMLDSLSANEHKVFSQYLLSPFFGCSKEVISLYKILSVGLDQPEADRKEIFKILNPGKRYDDKNFRYAISELNSHLVNFLTIRQLEKEPLLIESIAGRALSARDCEKTYLKIHNEILNYDTYQNPVHYHQKFNDAENYLTYTGNKLNRKATPDYSDTLYNLDIFYLLKKLQLSCEVANLSNILKTTYEIALLKELKELSQKKQFKEIPAVRIYFHILEMLTHAEPEIHFVSAGKLIKENSAKFNPKELGEMYQYLKNYCVRKVNQGNSDYLRILFNIYSDMLENKPLMSYDYLSQWEYKNMVSISLRINEKSWCEKFIFKYNSFLKPEERQNALAYNLAYFMFINDEYHKAIRKLQEVTLNDVFYQLDARVILLKCYYELDETDSFFYQASSFRLFLLRNRHISDYQKNIYRNLIKFLTAIVRANYSKSKLQKLRKEIEIEKNVADLNWLRFKVEEAILL